MIKLVETNISITEVREIAEKTFGDMVKAVVDTEKEIMAIGAGMYSDEESLLREKGSLQQNLWGINIYPALNRSEWIEYDSVINIRSWQNNRTRGIEDKNTRTKIEQIVNKLISD